MALGNPYRKMETYSENDRKNANENFIPRIAFATTSGVTCDQYGCMVQDCSISSALAMEISQSHT